MLINWMMLVRRDVAMLHSPAFRHLETGLQRRSDAGALLHALNEHLCACVFLQGHGSSQKTGQHGHVALCCDIVVLARL